MIVATSLAMARKLWGWIWLTGIILASSGSAAWLLDLAVRHQSAKDFVPRFTGQMPAQGMTPQMLLALRGKFMFPEGMRAPDFSLPAAVGDSMFHLADHIG